MLALFDNWSGGRWFAFFGLVLVACLVGLLFRWLLALLMGVEDRRGGLNWVLLVFGMVLTIVLVAIFYNKLEGDIRPMTDGEIRTSALEIFNGEEFSEISIVPSNERDNHAWVSSSRCVLLLDLSDWADDGVVRVDENSFYQLVATLNTANRLPDPTAEGVRNFVSTHCTAR